MQTAISGAQVSPSVRKEKRVKEAVPSSAFTLALVDLRALRKTERKTFRKYRCHNGQFWSWPCPFHYAGVIWSPPLQYSPLQPAPSAPPRCLPQTCPGLSPASPAKHGTHNAGSGHGKNCQGVESPCFREIEQSNYQNSSLKSLLMLRNQTS